WADLIRTGPKRTRSLPPAGAARERPGEPPQPAPAVDGVQRPAGLPGRRSLTTPSGRGPMACRARARRPLASAPEGALRSSAADGLLGRFEEPPHERHPVDASARSSTLRPPRG